MSESEIPAPIPPRLRRLVHDVKNQLYVINMGLEVLRGSHADPEEIIKLVNSIRTDGLEPLKASITRLVEAASQNFTSPAEPASDDVP